MLVALTLGLAAPQVHAEAALTIATPFRSRADQDGALELVLAPGAHALLAGAHLSGQVLTLEDWPLLGGHTTRARVRPVSAFERGGQARVVAADGSVGWLAPSVVCFSGALEGGGEVFFGVTPTEVHGYFRAGGELHFLSSGGSQPGSAWLTSGNAFAPPDSSDVCGVPAPSHARSDDPDGRAEALVTPLLRTAAVLIEADNVFRGLFASDQACVDYSTLLLTAASEVYRRDVGVRLALPNGYLRVWNSVPPWGAITTFGDITAVRNWWTSHANPDRSLPRAAVHVFTSPVFGGVANSIGGVCVNVNGFEISSLFGHFPSPRVHTHNDNWDLLVVTHEFGHSFGCQHSFDFSPPIQCQDGSGPDQGTIMSYCHLSFGVGGVGMRFHVREQRTIQNHFQFVDCLAPQALDRGDYDADGTLGPADLAALDAVLAQGFRSLAAEEVLDFDGNGTLNSNDRALLAASLGTPPASSAFRNGRGTNNECLYAIGNPVLGRTWTPTVVAQQPGRLVQLFFYDLPHPGLRTPYGELLVLPTGLGGSQLFTTARLSTGILEPFALTIPANASLVGLSTTLQALVLGPPVTELCNALDLVFGTYE